MSTRSFALLATAVFALACWLAASLGVPADDASEVRSTAVHAASAAATPAASRATPVRDVAATQPSTPPLPPPSRPSSLTGTEIDGAFTVGDDGRFVADRQAVRLFDYFLSTAGERDDAAIADDVRRVARARLSPDNADRAMALYERYRRYRETLSALMGGGGGAPGDARAALSLARYVQIQTFGTTDAERMFGSDDALAGLMIDRAAAR